MEESSSGKSLDEVDLTDDEKSLNEVLKQSKPLTFLFLLCLIFPKIFFLTTKGKVGKRSLTKVTSGGQNVKF